MNLPKHCLPNVCYTLRIENVTACLNYEDIIQQIYCSRNMMWGLLMTYMSTNITKIVPQFTITLWPFLASLYVY